MIRMLEADVILPLSEDERLAWFTAVIGIALGILWFKMVYGCRRADVRHGSLQSSGRRTLQMFAVKSQLYGLLQSSESVLHSQLDLSPGKRNLRQAEERRFHIPT